jgi:SAM-dependent methyltransferase
MTSIEEARAYVGTTPLSGLAQLALLDYVGSIDTHLLEIGCGSLHFAKAFMATRRTAYCGMDPNPWLRAAARREDPVLDRLCKQYATFSDADDFDGKKAFGHLFDTVFAHSVLSHVGHVGLHAFLAGAARSLWPGGNLIASVNIAPRLTPGTMGDDWTYPEGVTVEPTVLREALIEHGFTVEVRPDLRELYMSWCPEETHDWIVVTRMSR